MLTTLHNIFMIIALVVMLLAACEVKASRLNLMATALFFWILAEMVH